MIKGFLASGLNSDTEEINLPETSFVTDGPNHEENDRGPSNKISAFSASLVDESSILNK